MLPSPAGCSRRSATNARISGASTRVTTLTETAARASSLGTLLGVVARRSPMSFLPPTRAAVVLPVMVVSQALPVFAIAPLLVLWFGFGLASKVVMATHRHLLPRRLGLLWTACAAPTRSCSISPVSAGAGRWRRLALLRVPVGAAGARSPASGSPPSSRPSAPSSANGSAPRPASATPCCMANGRTQTDVVFAALLILAAMSVAAPRRRRSRSRRNLTPWVEREADR